MIPSGTTAVWFSVGAIAALGVALAMPISNKVSSFYGLKPKKIGHFLIVIVT